MFAVGLKYIIVDQTHICTVVSRISIQEEILNFFEKNIYKKLFFLQHGLVGGQLKGLQRLY